MVKSSSSKIKEIIEKNSFLSKSLLFLAIFVIEVLFIKLFINTGETSGFKLIPFNFQATELPLYFILILLVLSKDKIFNLKSDFKDRKYLLLISHFILLGAFIFYTNFIIKSKELVQSNVLLFQITWYVSALAPIILLFLFFFPIKEIKDVFWPLKKEISISVILSIIFLYSFEQLALFFEKAGLISAKAALFFLQKMFPSLVMVERGDIILQYGQNVVSYSALCSGALGFIFFIAFFLIYLIANFKQIDKTRYLVAFIVGFFIFVAVDIIRNFSFLLIWLLKPGLGVELFHSNLRPIFYTISLLISFFLFRDWVKLPAKKSKFKKR